MDFPKCLAPLAVSSLALTSARRAPMETDSEPLLRQQNSVNVDLFVLLCPISF